MDLPGALNCSPFLNLCNQSIKFFIHDLCIILIHTIHFHFNIFIRFEHAYKHTHARTHALVVSPSLIKPIPNYANEVFLHC